MLRTILVSCIIGLVAVNAAAAEIIEIPLPSFIGTYGCAGTPLHPLDKRILPARQSAGYGIRSLDPLIRNGDRRPILVRFQRLAPALYGPDSNAVRCRDA